VYRLLALPMSIMQILSFAGPIDGVLCKACRSRALPMDYYAIVNHLLALPTEYYAGIDRSLALPMEYYTNDDHSLALPMEY